MAALKGSPITIRMWLILHKARMPTLVVYPTLSAKAYAV
jgi:hypothetical protein